MTGGASRPVLLLAFFRERQLMSAAPSSKDRHAMASNQVSWTGAVDRIGIVASSVCFVHCLLTPVVLSLSAVYAHFLPTEEHTHRILAVAVTLIGAMAIGSGYRRHKKSSILWLMATGLALIFTGAYCGDRLPSHWTEVVITLVGSTCMIAAHRLNHTFCGRCDSCG
jgi:uncharacterized membrane protein YozB (DUF420 family)